MLFWMLSAILTVVVTIVTLRPLLARAPEAPATGAANPDLRVYKDQLAEIQRDIARGLLSKEEGEAARVEISRRILAAAPDEADGKTIPAQASTTSGSLVFYLAAAVIATSSLGLYLINGSPGYGGRPYAERASAPASGAPVDELIARVEARLRESPEDGRGWDVLAPVYLKQQRYSDAITAFGRAISLLGESRARLRGLAEAHLAATNGVVGSEVRQAFRKILANEPNLVAPRFWLAVGLEQDGDRSGAKSAYEALLKTEAGTASNQLPPALRQLIAERLAALSTGDAGTSRQSEGDAAWPRDPKSGGNEIGKGPPPPAGMATGMAPQERAAMIEQMVSGLAQRLNENGGSEQEWQRLIRAYWVLGRKNDAATTLARAKQQFTNDTAGIARLDAFARSLGLDPG